MAWTTPVLLHFEGTNGADGPYTNDNSTGPTFARPPSGIATLSTSNPKFGAAGLAGGTDNQFGGLVGSTSLSLLKDFSVETWFYTTNIGFNGAVWSIGDWTAGQSLVVRLNSDVTNNGKIRVTYAGTEIAASVTSITSFTLTSIGLFVANGTGYLTMNGALEATFSMPGPVVGIPCVGAFYSGGSLSAISSSYGFFHDEFRITDGLARQSAFPYPVATAAFVLDQGMDMGARQGVRGPKFRSGSTQVATSLNAYELAIDPVSYAVTAADETLSVGRALSVDPASYAVTASPITLSFGAVLNISPALYTITAANETLTATRALSIDPASYAITTSAITLSVGRALSFDPATYAITASAETLTATRALTISPASYAVTAAAVSLTATRTLSIDPATYSLTTSPETLSVGKVLSVAPVSYTITAAAETLSVGRVLSIDPASYVISAAAITLTYTSTAAALSIDPASYVLTAAPVTMTATRALSIAPASYSITAAAVTLSVGRQIDIGAASYSITASPVTLIAERFLTIAPASYIITAPDWSLTYTPAGSIDYEALAAAVWAYTLSNGKTAEQTVVETHDMLEALSALPNLDTPIEGAFSSSDLLRIIAAVAAGKTTIDPGAPGTATVEFRDVNDTEVRVSAEMVGSERASVTINPS